MKILIRSTTLDGEPIPGSGETLQADDCLEVVELMRGQTPFAASRAPRDYMTEVLSGIEGGPTQPLPEDAAAAAAEFLTRLPRYAEVDSELIFRLADRFAPEGPIDQEGLKKALALCRGQMSAVLTSRLDPGTITVLKGNKPLCLRIHRQHRVVLYASDDAFIDFAVVNEKGWRELEVPPMTMLTIRYEDVRAIENSEFRFIPQERKGTLPEGVNA